jgi:protein tyrosine/serine phosphatase
MERKMLRRRIVFFASAAALLLSVYSTHAMTCETTSIIGPRPSTWAVQMKSTCHVPNFYKINDNLYRSAQPTAIGMEQLKQMGIKTIINLRTFHSDTDEIGSTGLLNERLHVKNWHIEDEDVIKVMRILANRENGPYLIHCHYGADRTGVMCAMYRIIYQGWTKEEAIDEMVNGGYGFYNLWTNIIHYIQSADIDKLKKAIQAKRTAG